MRFSIYQESRQGPRKMNQDRIAHVYTRDALALIVADGMGGHLHGEVAAQIATQFIVEAFQREAQPRLDDPFRFLLGAITNAHHSIIDYANQRNLLETPRTTCVACVVQDGIAHWAHVGDSRLYHIREGRVENQTKDHSRVQILVDAGRIREEAVAVHPDRNKIFNCLGQMSVPKVDLSRRVGLNHGDTLILCTDGFWGALSSKLICEELLRTPDLATAMPKLMDMAEGRAGRDGDNLSVVAMGWIDQLGEVSPTSISTVAMSDREYKSTVQHFQKTAPPAAPGYLTDDEIERAIEEIRLAIKKNSK
ncbi:MAG: serine/threonine-protein phosphatase [Burkholderiales bacterium]|nr:serine/threonine-protein phosphatase [Burkholderiales bacterium]